VPFLSSIIGGNFVGAQGFQGVQGTQGLQGISNQGVQGTQGLQGTQGIQGTQGLQGTQGRQGTQGLQGLQATQGTQGLSNQGAQGLQGLIGPASSWALVAKTTDESRNNNNTTSADSALSFSMTSGLTYTIRGLIFYTTTAQADFAYRFSGPATSFVSKYVVISNTNDTGGNPFTISSLDTSLDTVDNSVTDNVTGLVVISLNAVVIPSANNNFEFWWAQNTSNSGPTTVYAGSYLEYAIV